MKPASALSPAGLLLNAYRKTNRHREVGQYDGGVTRADDQGLLIHSPAPCSFDSFAVDWPVAMCVLFEDRQ